MTIDEYKAAWHEAHKPLTVEQRMIRDLKMLGIPESVARYQVSRLLPITKVSVGTRVCSF
jgi:hypothetical protein